MPLKIAEVAAVYRRHEGRPEVGRLQSADEVTLFVELSNTTGRVRVLHQCEQGLTRDRLRYGHRVMLGTGLNG